MRSACLISQPVPKLLKVHSDTASSDKALMRSGLELWKSSPALAFPLCSYCLWEPYVLISGKYFFFFFFHSELIRMWVAAQQLHKLNKAKKHWLLPGAQKGKWRAAREDQAHRHCRCFCCSCYCSCIIVLLGLQWLDFLTVFIKPYSSSAWEPYSFPSTSPQELQLVLPQSGNIQHFCTAITWNYCWDPAEGDSYPQY